LRVARESWGRFWRRRNISIINGLRLGIALIVLLGGAAARAEEGVYIYVLGIAQDAGYPQTSCYQPHCMRAWEDKNLRRTACSIAVVDESTRSKYLFDATPDMREQLYELHKTAPDGEYKLDGVFLTHAHIGHYTGIMHFGHEAMGAKNIPVYAMPRMREYLSTSGPWDQLVRYENIVLKAMQDGEAEQFGDRLRVTPFLVPHRDEYSETVGYRIDGPKKSAVFIPDIDKWATSINGKSGRLTFEISFATLTTRCSTRHSSPTENYRDGI